VSQNPVITSPDSPAHLTIDALTGMPLELGVEDSHGTLSRPIHMAVSAEMGGTELRHPTGGLMYENTEIVSGTSLTSGLRRVHRGVCDEYQADGTLGPLKLTLHYRLFPVSPFVEVAATLHADDAVLVRNLTVDVTSDNRGDSLLNIPGNMVRRNLPVSDFGDKPVGVSPIGGLRGSSGIVSLTDSEATLSIWPNQPTEIPDIAVSAKSNTIHVNVGVNFAAEISPENSAELLLMTLNVERGDFEVVRHKWSSWASRYGLTSPANPPEWMYGAGIYEVQIGTSYFWKDNAYCRYEEIRDLIADLDRVHQLGFRVIQLMPRQPYPSYNVHDYADVSTSYGDEKELRTLVSLCHDKGMRVILDVLLHGVLDNESINSAVDGVVNGPLWDSLDEDITDTLASDLTDDSGYWRAWSRHIMDFSEHWRGGSPAVTPLQSEHPDWFATDSAGNVSGVYTKAFDARSPSWQRYFRESMMHLVTEYDVDGFRFDAPTYNFFANWAPWAKARAFMSPLGCIPLFVDMRHDIKTTKPDALMYTEPSGHLLRRSMDVNYNYDEQWLVSALLQGAHTGRAVANAKDFMKWISDRDDFLPEGSHTAHHIDSHDTFWWPQWGKKWRREQYPIEAVQALAAAFLSLDGPYMMFTGGEEGIEEVLHGLLSLRNNHRELWAKRGVFDTDADPSGDLVIVRRDGTQDSLVTIVNMSADESRPVPAEYTGANWSAAWHVRGSNSSLEPFGILALTATR
jgi:glycosidase